MDEFVIIGKMNAFDQLYVARKLAGGYHLLEGIIGEENKTKDRSLLAVMLLSYVADSDVQGVLSRCLSVVVRQTPTGAAKMLSPEGALMFSDIKIDSLIKIMLRVVEDSLGDFFRTALSGAAAAKQKASEEPATPA